MNELPPGLDLQDPLPEPNMGWRRFGAFLVCLCVNVFIGVLIWFKLPDKDALTLCFWLLLSQAFVLLLYFGGANSVDLARVIQAGSVFKQIIPHFGPKAVAPTEPQPVGPEAAELPESQRLP
jgi:hypothetical protein